MIIHIRRGPVLDDLYKGILTLDSLEKCSTIEAEAHASTAVISRVKRTLYDGNNMYELLFTRMSDKQKTRSNNNEN
ncbi:Trp family transcriptional regulator [Paenibacillus agilis]|uniref:Uncharacterized protein n=1 Tax=Paenibacillus agilis TaxID=3020863 RepID=A0A559IKC4_9BACL|nr:Trp family transcriptional regulator [Paenibacillus agilis]TVX88104.1 hypothetical protein FPZ44_19540 [Paenibacillus agilis]